jgi:hypothetical protein
MKVTLIDNNWWGPAIELPVTRELFRANPQNQFETIVGLCDTLFRYSCFITRRECDRWRSVSLRDHQFVSFTMFSVISGDL